MLLYLRNLNHVENTLNKKPIVRYNNGERASGLMRLLVLLRISRPRLVVRAILVQVTCLESARSKQNVAGRGSERKSDGLSPLSSHTRSFFSPYLLHDIVLLVRRLMINRILYGDAAKGLRTKLRAVRRQNVVAFHRGAVLIKTMDTLTFL